MFHVHPLIANFVDLPFGAGELFFSTIRNKVDESGESEPKGRYPSTEEVYLAIVWLNNNCLEHTEHACEAVRCSGGLRTVCGNFETFYPL